METCISIMLNNLKLIYPLKKNTFIVLGTWHGYDSVGAMFQIFSLISQSLFMKHVNYLEN